TEPELGAVPQNSVHRLAFQGGGQAMRAQDERTVLRRQRIRQASQGRNYHMAMDVFGNALCAGEGAAEAEYSVEDLAIEAEDLVAGLGPEAAIGGQVERVNLRTAG